MKLRVPVLEGIRNQREASTARGHSDMNSINPHEVRIQLIQPRSEVSSCSVRARRACCLSLASLLRAPALRAQEILLAIRTKRTKLCLQALSPFKLQIALGIFRFLQHGFCACGPSSLPTGERAKGVDIRAGSGWRGFCGNALNGSNV